MGSGTLNKTIVGKDSTTATHCNYKRKLRLYHAKRKPYINNIQKGHLFIIVIIISIKTKL